MVWLNGWETLREDGSTSLSKKVRIWGDLQSCRSIIQFNYVECKNTVEFELNVIVEIACLLKLG